MSNNQEIKKYIVWIITAVVFFIGYKYISKPHENNSVNKVQAVSQKIPQIEIIVSPIEFGTFEVMTQDLGQMTWEQANIEVSKLGDGWRLPNLPELNRLFENMQTIGGFHDESSYWSSEVNKYGDPFIQRFNIDYTTPHQNSTWHEDLNWVRAVRSKK